MSFFFYFSCYFQRTTSIISKVIIIFYFLVSACFLFVKFIFFDGLEFLAFFEDDFFYYLETSKNFIQYGFPTLDYQTHTNGFHPLWFLILTTIQFISADPFFVTFSVTLLVLLSHIYSFYLLHRIYRIYFNNDNSYYFAIISSSLYLIYLTSGMEIILAIPLVILLILKILDRKGNYLQVTMISSVLFLARIDAFILIFLLIIYFILHDRSIFSKIKYYFPFVLIIIYLIVNLIYFDTILPISGQAKQLKTTLFPVTNPFMSIFNLYLDRIIFALIPFIMSIINIFIINLNKENKLLFHLLNIFPFVFILINSILSGWYMWSWYFYIFLPGIIVFFISFGNLIKMTKAIKFSLISVSFLISLFYIILAFKRDSSDTLYYENAIRVSNFEKSHPGKYAIGDRAGLISYLIDSPVVQLEGLTMDKDYLHNLKTTIQLSDLLEKYNIDYYIASMVKKANNGGWIVEEPYKHHKYVITSKDTLFAEPIIIEDSKGWKFYIFDLNKKYSK